jgi:uncharacterized repeat protein (TIGR01451 family)
LPPNNLKKKQKMKKNIFLLLVLISGISNAQDIVFADNDFKLKLLASDVTNNIAKTLGGNNIKIDADNNGQITVQEAALVYELLIPSEPTINNIGGILSFVNLVDFDARDCSISGSVNLSNLDKLQNVSLNNNQITALDVAGCIAMKELDCNDNLIQEIDVSSLINLEDLKVANNPILKIFAKNGTDEAIDFSGVLNQNINYICADEIQVINLQGQVTNGCIVNSYCTDTPGGKFNTIAGALLFDATGNGQDVTDLPQSYVKLQSILGNDDSTILQTVTDSNAAYSFATTEIGGFDVLPAVENPTWFTITPAIGNFIDSNNNTFNQNFLLAPVGIHFDVEAMIRPISQVVPGSNVTYEIVFKNKGNQTHSGAVTFGYNEAVLDFVSSTVPLVNNGTGLLSLAYSNLLPFETRSFRITLNLDNSVSINDVLSFAIAISPNGENVATQFDNSVIYNQKVVTTNPNRIECIQGTSLSNSEIGKYLHYAINFENTGNQEAKNVVVTTTFDPAKYDTNSTQILNASHPLKLSSKNENMQINLRKANVRGPGGQGGILLKVKTVDTLIGGATANVKAEIFFDYETIQTAPIVATTELVETTFQNLTKAQNNIDTSMSIYPNPTTSSINIESRSSIKTIELFDVYGRLLQTNLQDDATAKLDLSQRAEGIYFVKITSDKGQRVEKVVKK